MTDKISARFSPAGSIRTLGLLARGPGETRYCLTAEEAVAAVGSGLSAGMDSGDLLRAIPATGDVLPPTDPHLMIRFLCDLTAIFGEDVQRFHPNYGRIHGLVSSFRGAVLFRSASGSVLVRNLIEVKFDETDGLLFTPALVKDDLGSLITTWDGSVVGLLVGGRGLVAYVAPLHDFLPQNQLLHETHVPAMGNLNEFAPRTVEAEAGIASFGAQLAREPSLNFDDLEEAA